MTTASDTDYENLFAFRCALRRFLQWSEARAADEGLTSQQHQVLLAIRAHRGDAGPSIGQLAEYLMTRHHSAVELIRRVESMGLVKRVTDDDDRRVVRLRLTPRGAGVLDRLTTAHLVELEHAAALLHIPEALLVRLSEEYVRQHSPPVTR